MADKALISEHTWRSLEMQRAAFPGMPHYRAPDEISHMFRPTTRQEGDCIWVMSLAIIAEKEREVREFLSLLRQRRAILRSEEDNSLIVWKTIKPDEVVKAWKVARKAGIQKIGGRISADLRKKQSAEAAAKIKDRWPLPSKTWRTSVLLREADISYNTAKSILGSRIVAQANYVAAQKRKAQRSMKENIFAKARGA